MTTLPQPMPRSYGQGLRAGVVYGLTRLSASLGGPGLLASSRWGPLFYRAYALGKLLFDDPFNRLLALYPQLLRRGHILDVGANVGFTARSFARLAGPGFKVYCFEPEATNLEVLRRTLRHEVAAGKVETVACAVGGGDGEAELWHNPWHHGDHRVVTESLQRRLHPTARVCRVAVRSLDSFVAERSLSPHVGFIKVDVQGYEPAVLAGLQETLARNPNATLALEYAPAVLDELGFSGREVLDLCRSGRFTTYLLPHRRPPVPLTRKALDDQVERRGYVDLLLTPSPLSTPKPGAPCR